MISTILISVASVVLFFGPIVLVIYQNDGLPRDVRVIKVEETGRKTKYYIQIKVLWWETNEDRNLCLWKYTFSEEYFSNEFTSEEKALKKAEEIREYIKAKRSGEVKTKVTEIKNKRGN